MIKNKGTEINDAMTTLAAYYINDVQGERSQDLNTSNAFCTKLNNIAGRLLALAKSPLSKDLLAAAENEISSFMNEYNISGYYDEVINNFSEIAPHPTYISVLMVLDYYYTNDSGAIQAVDRSNEGFDLILEKFSVADCLLTCFYIGKKDEKGKNGVSEFVAKRADHEAVYKMSVQDYIEVMMRCLLIYKGALASKVSVCQNSPLQSSFDGFVSILSDNYKTKLEVTPVLTNFISEIAKTGELQFKPETVTAPDYKMGGCVYKNTNISYLPDGCLKLSYMVNGIDRNVFISPDVIGSVTNYAVYLDLVALILVMRSANMFNNEKIAPIVQKYNLLYSRSVNIEESAYSDFLDLFEI